MKDKLWTARDGQIGTAHVSRDGKIVDFRPARWVHVQFGDIFAEPPRGQEHGIKSLRLAPHTTTVRVIRKDAHMVGEQDVVDILQANFAGEEIVVEGEQRWEWYDKAAETACNVSTNDRQRDRQRRIKKQEEFINSFPAAEVARRATRSVSDRVRFGAMSAGTVFFNIVMTAGQMAFGDDFRRDFWREVEYIASKRCDEVKATITAVDERRRAEKKAAWMSKNKG